MERLSYSLAPFYCLEFPLYYWFSLNFKEEKDLSQRALSFLHSAVPREDGKGLQGCRLRVVVCWENCHSGATPLWESYYR